MGWHERLVYYRDFAYSTPRLRMANGNIGHVPAQTFAEYVDDPFLERGVGDGDGDSNSGSDSDSDSDSDDGVDGGVDGGLPGESLRAVNDNDNDDDDDNDAPRPSCLAVRPALAHRLYSHRLHVRAKAKLHRDRLLSGPMIDIYVGEARRRWTLHRNLLCHHSEQLEAELEGYGNGHGDGHGDRKDALELPDHDPAGFELLVKWLYQGKLDDVSDLPDPTHKYEYAVHCHALYLLCHRFDMPQLKNVAMDQFRKGLNESALVPDPDELDDIYRKSPLGSPFRRLMVQIAARQIMDPDSDRDTASYRQCFDGNPDFAVELVNAIRQGTGGMLLADPTDKGNECDYHDHEDGPNCNIKGKGKAKQARKARARPDPSSARSTASTSSDPPSHPHHPPPSHPPLRPARPPRPGSSGAGPLLRRLTSPATPTAGTSADTAVASRPPSPEATKDWEKLKSVLTPEKPVADQVEAPKPPPALDERRQSSEGESPLQPPRAEAEAEGTVVTNGSAHQSPPRRGIWDWARAGTGRLSIIGRLPHPDWTGPASASKAEGLVVNGPQENRKTTESHDDFDIPSSTATEPDNIEQQKTTAAAKIEGLGISPFGTLMPPTDFSQTAGSSDDLIANASETTGSPSPLIMNHRAWTNGNDTTPTASKPTSPTTPDTPTPLQQQRSDSIMEMPKTREISKDTVSKNLQDNIAALTPPGSASAHVHPSHPKTPKESEAAASEFPSSAPAKANGSANSSQRRVPTYKIALTSSLLSPTMRGSSRSASAAH